MEKKHYYWKLVDTNEAFPGHHTREAKKVCGNRRKKVGRKKGAKYSVYSILQGKLFFAPDRCDIFQEQFLELPSC